MYYKNAEGEFVQSGDFKLTTEDGTAVESGTLDESTIYEVHITAQDGGDTDIDSADGCAKVSIVLVYDA